MSAGYILGPRANVGPCPTCGSTPARSRPMPGKPADDPIIGSVRRCHCGQVYGFVQFPPRHPQAPPWLLEWMERRRVEAD